MSYDTVVRNQVDRRRLLKQSPVRSTHFCYSPRAVKRVSILESKLEKDYYNVLLFDRRLQCFDPQPFSIHYQMGGREFRYTPDFLEIDWDGVWVVTETKWWSETLTDFFQHKFAILRAHFESQGQQFKIVTERDVYVGARASNLRYLKPALQMAAPVAEIDTLRKTLPYRSLSLTNLMDVIRDYGWDETIVRRAIAHGLMQCDLTVPWKNIELSW